MTTDNGTQAETSLSRIADQNPLVATGDSWWNDSAKFALIQRAAKMFSSSSLVPPMYQGPNGIGSCVIALNMAARMEADPLMVMQNLYVVHGRPSWSAQFLIACFNQTGRFAPMRYRWSGTEGTDDWGCQAWSTDRETGEEIDGPLITIGMAKSEGWFDKRGSKWRTIPQLMLMYRAAAWLVRTYAPEIAMGLRTEDEEHDVAAGTAAQGRGRFITDRVSESPLNDLADNLPGVGTTTTTDGTDTEEEPQEAPAATEESTEEQPGEAAEATQGHTEEESVSSGSGAEGTAPDPSLLPDEPLRRKPGEAVHAWTARVSEAIKATNDPAELKDIEQFLNAERDAGRVMKTPHSNLMSDLVKRETALGKT